MNTGSKRKAMAKRAVEESRNLILLLVIMLGSTGTFMRVTIVGKI